MCMRGEVYMYMFYNCVCKRVFCVHLCMYMCISVGVSLCICVYVSVFLCVHARDSTCLRIICFCVTLSTSSSLYFRVCV